MAILIGALVSIFKLFLEAFRVPVVLVTGIFDKAATAFDLIINDPFGFLSNILVAIKLGFLNFFGNIGIHLLGGVVDWLFGGLREMGIEKPKDLSSRSIFGLILDILGLSLETVFKRLELKIGPDKVRL